MNIYITFLSLLFLGTVPTVEAMIVPQFALKVVEYCVIGSTVQQLLNTSKNMVFPDNRPDNKKDQKEQDLITKGLEEIQKENDKEIGFTSTVKSLVSSVTHPNKWLFAAFFCPQYVAEHIASGAIYQCIRQCTLLATRKNVDLDELFMRQLCTRYPQFDVVDLTKKASRMVLEGDPENASIKRQLEILNKITPDDNKPIRYKLLGGSLHLLLLPIFLKCILPIYSKYFHKYAPQKAAQIKSHTMPISHFFNENRHKLFFTAIGSHLLLSLMIKK